MSRKNQQRKQEARSAQPLPYRWTLPRDLLEVKIIAYAQAYFCAYKVIRENLDYTETHIHAMAVTTCLDLEQAVIEGMQGTNDSALYRETFIEVFRQEYPGAYEGLKNSPSLYMPEYDVPDEERMAAMLIYAREHYVSLN